MNNDLVRLNVILLTYNQEQYIRETVKSILEQKTKFLFNIIVADDCSTDNTVKVVKELDANSDIQFCYLSAEKNMGIMKNYKRAFEACSAEYIAIMEGDDLWIDPLRLQKHVDFLDIHSDCAMSFNRYQVRDFSENTFRVQPKMTSDVDHLPYQYFTGFDLARDNIIGNFSTCIYRISSIRALPEEMYQIHGYDWLLNIMVSKMGYIGCLYQVMNIYRIHSGGTWSCQSNTERLQEMIDVIDCYNEFTDYEFAEAFKKHKMALIIEQKTTGIETKFRLKALIVNGLVKCVKICRFLPSIVMRVLELFIPPYVITKIKQKCNEE